jgi:flagellar basal-body rod protein FlgB
MSQGIEALSTATLSLALDAATLRHQVIAANIANAGSVGFVPQRVRFEAQVDQAMKHSGRSDANANSPAPRLNVRIEPDVAEDGRPRAVQLDAEVAALSQNNLHYQALLRALNRQLSMLSTAVSDGKR